jgi:hypothetical protein
MVIKYCFFGDIHLKNSECRFDEKYEIFLFRVSQKMRREIHLREEQILDEMSFKFGDKYDFDNENIGSILYEGFLGVGGSNYNPIHGLYYDAIVRQFFWYEDELCGLSSSLIWLEKCELVYDGE